MLSSNGEESKSIMCCHMFEICLPSLSIKVFSMLEQLLYFWIKVTLDNNSQWDEDRVQEFGVWFWLVWQFPFVLLYYISEVLNRFPPQGASSWPPALVLTAHLRPVNQNDTPLIHIFHLKLYLCR